LGSRGLEPKPSARSWGEKKQNRFSHRVPTSSFALSDSPRAKNNDLLGFASAGGTRALSAAKPHQTGPPIGAERVPRRKQVADVEHRFLCSALA